MGYSPKGRQESDVTERLIVASSLYQSIFKRPDSFLCQLESPVESPSEFCILVLGSFNSGTSHLVLLGHCYFSIDILHLV